MSNNILDFLSSWGPMILLIIVWIFFMKKSGSMGYRNYMEKSTKCMEESLVEMKLLNQKLDKVVALLEKNKGK